MTIHNQNSFILFINGTIYGYPKPSAFLCRDGKIIAVGKKDDFNIENSIDLNGGFFFRVLLIHIFIFWAQDSR